MNGLSFFQPEHPHRHETLTLSEEDLQLALEDVKEAICHNLDERDYIDKGLDAWEVTRSL